MIRYAWVRPAVRIIGLLLAGTSINGLGATVAIMLQWQSAGWWRATSYAGAPLQFALGLYLLLDGRAVARWLIRGAEDRCPRCGYDVSASASAQCTECGFRLRD